MFSTRGTRSAHRSDDLAALGASIHLCLLDEPILHVSGKADDDLGQIPAIHVDTSNHLEQCMATGQLIVNRNLAIGHLGDAMSSDFPSRGLDKFVLRLPDGMREKIGIAARNNKRTMTAEIAERGAPCPEFRTARPLPARNGHRGGGDAMHGADEGTLPAAHHAEPDVAAPAELLPPSMAIPFLPISARARARSALVNSGAHRDHANRRDRTTEAIGRFNQLRRGARRPAPRRARSWP